MSAMLTAFVMLYFRLPDSIRAGVCRSAHDCYVHEKIKLKKARPEPSARPLPALCPPGSSPRPTPSL